MKPKGVTDRQIAREFKSGCSLDWLCRKYDGIKLGEIEQAIRKYVRLEGGK